LRQANGERDKQISSLYEKINDHSNENIGLRQANGERDKQIISLHEEIGKRDDKIVNLQEIIKEKTYHVLHLEEVIGEREKKLIHLEKNIDEILNTRIWKIIKATRFLGKYLKSFCYYNLSCFIKIKRQFRFFNILLRAWLVFKREGLGGVILKLKKRSILSFSFINLTVLKKEDRNKELHVNALVKKIKVEEAVNILNTDDPLLANQFVSRINTTPDFSKSVKVLCFYLPQFHTIPENDLWWGKGFTEWTNVVPAKKYFRDHYQPHVPESFIGYYNLAEQSTLIKQVDLAKKYSIDGFCFYLYWFDGKRLLESPLDAFLNNPDLDLSYCVCWANENWSRRWDGLDKDLLITQQYSEKDDLAFIEEVAKYLRDPRYIRVDGKPLLMIYRPSLFPNIRATSTRWRDWCSKNGVGDIYLVYPQSFESVDPTIYGFDAATEFPPNNSSPPKIKDKVEALNPNFNGEIYDWNIFIDRSNNYLDPGYKLFRGINPGWDNTARKKERAVIFSGSSPSKYQKWLSNAINDTCKRTQNKDERIIFVNAWNEWAEGAHLEPDEKYGYAWLEATRVAQARIYTTNIVDVSCINEQYKFAIVIHAYYIDVLEQILKKIPPSLRILSKIFISTVIENFELVKGILEKEDINFEIFIFENRGRDVLPFLKMLKNLNEQGFPYIIKLHTKKSLHREDGDLWRNDLYMKLLNESLHKKLPHFLKKYSNVGLVAPEGYLSPLSYYFGSNKEEILMLCRRLGIQEIDLNHTLFVAGTMFIAKTSALIHLLDISISGFDFPEEAGQVDGTLAHAFERIFALTVKASGFDIITTANIINLESCSCDVSLNDFYKPFID
jgi:lipopolysaccharide biosynthesis protein